MLSVDQHIAYLVMHNDCVIVPDWGAFISARTPARYDESTCCWSAPARRVAFNPDIVHNDGLLASSIVRREGVSYEEALSAVRDHVLLWNRKLDSEGGFTLDGVGRFIPDSGETPLFEPVHNCVANAANLGLQDLEITANDILHPTDVPESDRRIPLARLGHTLIRVAASVAIIVAVVAAFITSTTNENSPLYTASLFNSGNSGGRHVEEELSDRPLVISQGAELRIAIVTPDRGISVVDTVASDNGVMHDNPVVKTDVTRNYYLIVASLASEKEVARYLASRSADERKMMKVLSGDSRYRVYIASGTTFEEANRVKNADGYAMKYPDAWVYVRK